MSTGLRSMLRAEILRHVGLNSPGLSPQDLQWILDVYTIKWAVAASIAGNRDSTRRRRQADEPFTSIIQGSG